MGHRVWITLLILLQAATQIMAADLRLFVAETGAYRAIVIEGLLAPGDFDAFLRLVKENQGKITKVVVFSPGGDFSEAIRIGRAMRALELGSQVPVRSLLGQPLCEDIATGLRPVNPLNCTCASAGFFVHIGGVNREGSYLAVHRPYFASGKFGELDQNEARRVFDALQAGASRYMEEMGVPRYVQEDVLGTPSERALLLDDKTVRTYFTGPLPYLHEWRRNRCARLSASEVQRVEDFTGRLLRVRSASEINFARSEWEDYSFLRRKQDEELVCMAQSEHYGRLAAYERYFGSKADQLHGYDFASWSAAAGYLGKSFQALAADEGFAPSRLADANLLDLAATTSRPFVILSDDHSAPHVATRASLISTPEPSPEFTRHLVEWLERAWGASSGGNGTTEWRWDKPEFSAVLANEPVSPSGAVLHLVIEARGEPIRP